MSVKNEQEQILKWLQEHQVTKCPTAAVDKTTAKVNPADRVAIRKHNALKNKQKEEAKELRLKQIRQSFF